MRSPWSGSPSSRPAERAAAAPAEAARRAALRADAAQPEGDRRLHRGRIKTAGGDAAQLFTRDAVVAIHERSRGIPRIISVICDNALVNGFAADQKPVGAAIVAEVCKSLSFAVFRRT